MQLLFRKNIWITALALFIITTSGCLKSKKPGIPPRVLEVLNNSGIKKPDLLRAILEFDKPKDSAKLQAAYFLIQNLGNNYHIKSILTDSNNNILEINLNDFSNYVSIKKHLDSLEKISGKHKYHVDTIILDMESINSSFLINHINSVFSADKLNSWNSQYGDSIFNNFILPYRVVNEKTELCVKHFQEKYKTLSEYNNIVDAAKELNDKINTEFNYDNRLEINPNPQSISSTEKSKTGNSLDLNLYKIMALRSFGIAAALDYTPYFSDSILGYYSTTVILPDESEFRLRNFDNNNSPYSQVKTAKVYRRMYDKNPESLFSIKDKKFHTPPFLGNFNYIDVTEKYIQTTGITITISDTSKYIYLAIYNDNNWKPIDWTIVKPNGKAHFYNMGTGIVYMPVAVNKDGIKPIGEPFLLDLK